MKWGVSHHRQQQVVSYLRRQRLRDPLVARPPLEARPAVAHVAERLAQALGPVLADVRGVAGVPLDLAVPPRVVRSVAPAVVGALLPHAPRAVRARPVGAVRSLGAALGAGVTRGAEAEGGGVGRDEGVEADAAVLAKVLPRAGGGAVLAGVRGAVQKVDPTPIVSWKKEKKNFYLI